LALLADAGTRAGQVEAAFDVLEEALVTPDTHAERFYAADESCVPPRACAASGSTRASVRKAMICGPRSYDGFTEGFATADLQEARTLLDALT
jgi:hypothetical protein